MQTSEHLRATYNRIAQDYHQDHLNDTWDDDYTDFFIQALPKGVKVLDLGCGPGTDTVKLVNSGLLVSGFDLSDTLLEIAKKKNPGVVFLQGDMRHLPYPDGEFEGVYAKASLLHIPKKDMPKVLTEINRVMKPKGIVHIAVKNGDNESDMTENDYGYSYTRFYSYWKMPAFQNVLKKHGFTVVRSVEKDTGHTIWLQILAQKQ